MTSHGKIHHTMRWLLPAGIVLVVIVVFILWIRIPNFLVSQLSDYTLQKTEGNYELSINESGTGLFPLSLTFRDVTLEPAVMNLSDQEFLQDEMLYRFSAEEIRVEGLSLRLLLTHRILSGKKVKITKPEVTLAGKELLQVDSLDISTDVLKKIWPLVGYIEKVDFKKIEFEEADFGFYSAVGDTNFISKADKVSIDVHGFVTSAEMAGKSNQYFETDDILIRINNFQNDMGDSLHLLTIDSLFYSLKTTDIRVIGFHIFPIVLQQNENLIDVNVPEVYVKSRSITHFALSDSLKIGYLEFIKPHIKFFQKTQPEKIELEDIHDFDLYSLIKTQFLRLEVDSFYLQGASVDIYRQPDIQNFRQQFQSIDVILHGFGLDSASFLNQEKILHANDLEMHVKEFQLKLEDDEHHFRAGSLFASTFSNRLSAYDIQIFPAGKEQQNIRTEINIKCDSLSIKGVNFLNMYHRRIMPATIIEVVKPNVNLLYRLDIEKQANQAGSGLLFEVVTDYLEGVYADSVRVKHGRLNIRNSQNKHLKGYFETNIDFNLTEFKLDSASLQNSSNFFYATNFDLLFSEYNMRLTDDFHKLEVDTILVSSFNHMVQIENLKLLPDLENAAVPDMHSLGRSELFRITVPQITLQNVNLNNAFFNQKINIDHFNINRPQIYFENFGALKNEDENQEISEFYELLFSYIKDIDIKQFSISEGLLTWINHTRKGRTTSFDNEFSVSLGNFRLNELERSNNRLFFSDSFELTVNDQEFELSDNVHILKGSEIRFSSSKSTIKIKDALLFPLINSQKYNELTTTWQVAIPEINISGFDFQKAYFTQEPVIENLEIINPRFQVYIQPGKAKGLELKAYSFPMPSFIESLQISEINITGGEAITYRNEGRQHIAMANFFFGLSVPDMLVKNNDENQIQVSSGNINFWVTDFKTPVDDIHNLHIGSIEFDKGKKMIDISNLSLIPYLKDETRNQFSISVPLISFREFDFDSALIANRFIFNNITANEPSISISINKEIKDDTLEFLQTLDLYPYVEHLVNSISINSLNLNNVFLKFNWLKKQMFNNKLNLSFEGILLSENQPASNLLNSQEFSISTTSLSGKSRNGLYEYTADTLMYKSGNHAVFLKNIGINPLIDKEQFPLQDGFQTDVAKVEIEYLEFRAIDEKRWFNENILDARAMVIGPARIEIFRNKRFPFNESQRPDWPQDLIKSLKQPFDFDSVKLMPSIIKYSELLGILDEPGYIEFTDLKLSGNRFSNLEEVYKKHQLIIDAEARLMGEGLLSAQFTFDLSSPLYQHNIKGLLGPMPIELLNPMIMKSAPLKVETGKLNIIEFDISFREEFARGEIAMNYENLKIAILDYSGDEIERANFSSFLANTLKINSQNSGNIDVVPESIYYERDEKRSILHFWWKTLYTGIANVVGI
jgi:hypothetical protein